MKYGILWKFHAKVIEVNVDRICGCVTNSINLIGGFNHPIKKNRNIFVSCLHKAGGSALAAHSHRDCRRQRNDTHVGVSWLNRKQMQLKKCDWQGKVWQSCHLLCSLKYGSLWRYLSVKILLPNTLGGIWWCAQNHWDSWGLTWIYWNIM